MRYDIFATIVLAFYVILKKSKDPLYFPNGIKIPLPLTAGKVLPAYMASVQKGAES